MLASLFLIGSTLLGVALVQLIMRHLLEPLERLLWGTVCGWLLATLSGYLIARASGALTVRQLVVLTIAIWVLSTIILAIEKRSGSLRLSTALWRRHYAGLLIVLLLCTPIFAVLCWTHMFAPASGGVYSGGSAAYDLSFHAALTNSFVYAKNFPPRYLFLPTEPLHYPFVAAFQP